MSTSICQSLNFDLNNIILLSILRYLMKNVTECYGRQWRDDCCLPDGTTPAITKRGEYLRGRVCNYEVVTIFVWLE